MFPSSRRLIVGRGSKGQWEYARRLTYGDAVSQLGYHFTKSIAADDAGGVHVVWYDTRDGVQQIYYKRSTDHGVIWGPDTRLSPRPTPQEQPAIAVSGSRVYVVWHDMRRGDVDIYFKQSRDGGRTWGPDMLLSHGPSDSMYPSIAVSGSSLHVTFADNRNGQVQVYYVRSTDSGVTWSLERRLSGLPEDSWTPSVAASGNSVYVAWTDTRDGVEEEYIKCSHDQGFTWGPDTRLTNDLANSWAPVIDVSGNTVHYAWFTQKDNPIQPRDAERRLDEIMVLMTLPVQPEPAGVVLSRPPRNTKERIEVKLRKAYAAMPGWVPRGGEGGKLQALLQEFEQLSSPMARTEAQKQSDQAMRLAGLYEPPPPSVKAGEGRSLDEVSSARLEEEMRRIQGVVPEWVARSGQVKQLRTKLNIVSKLVDVQSRTFDEQEKRLDDVLKLVGLSVVPEKETTRVYYLDALQQRMQEKLQQVRAAAPAWVRRGGDAKQLNAVLEDVERMLKVATTQWQLYYRCSRNRGVTWEPEVRLTELGESGRRPSLAVVGDEVHLVWFDMREGQEGVYYRHSHDGGRTWGPETYLVEINSDWVHPSVAASRDFVHVVWADRGAGPPKIYYKRKINARWTWNYGE